jgi:hypothetical protein
MLEKRETTRKTMESYNRQAGAGMLTVMLFLVLLGITALAVLRVAPVYFEHTLVKKELQTVADGMNDKRGSQREVWRNLVKRLDINNIDYIQEQDLSIETRNGDRYLKLEYEVVRPFLANIQFLIDFSVETE